MGTQTFVVRLPGELARSVLTFLEGAGRGYDSLSEFVTVALVNQLATEQDDAPASSGRGSERPRSGLLAAPPTVDSTALLLSEPAQADGQALFVLTNRLSPAKMACRALANLAALDGGWPEVGTFQQEAGRAARELGQRLREEDEREGRGGLQRRWVAYPFGKDERAAIDRYIFSFTISTEGGASVGPLSILGLARLVGDRVALTQAGWDLAIAPSPLLGEAEGLTFSDEEARILRMQVRDAPAEIEAVREFLGLVRRAAGQQSRLDELLSTRHSEWTADFATAHRSAMLGRLRELGALDVSGRGPKAAIELLDGAAELEIAESEEALA